jgi:hypothetical protein
MQIEGQDWKESTSGTIPVSNVNNVNETRSVDNVHDVSDKKERAMVRSTFLIEKQKPNHWFLMSFPF